MEYKKKDDRYNEYSTYSQTVLKSQEVSEDCAVQGYISNEPEVRQNKKPVETMRMKNSDGQISIGVNRARETTLAITSDAAGPYLRDDRSFVKMGSANKNRNKIYTNSHDAQVSGVVYKADLAKSPERMIQSLKTALAQQENVVADTIAPFLVCEQDKKDKKELENYLRSHLEQGKTEVYQALKVEYDELNKKIARKEKEEQRLLHHLSSVSGKMKEEARRLEYDYQRDYHNVFGLSAETGEDGEDDTSGADDNKVVINHNLESEESKEHGNITYEKGE